MPDKQRLILSYNNRYRNIPAISSDIFINYTLKHSYKGINRYT
jgi:hypothetical protein